MVIIDTYDKNPEVRRKKQADLHRRVAEKLAIWTSSLSTSEPYRQNLPSMADMISGKSAKLLQRKVNLLNTQSKADSNPNAVEEDRKDSVRSGVLKIVYNDDLDLLIAGYEDSKICNSTL